MAKLIIEGKEDYIKKMFIHLRKEHPTTINRMRLVQNEYLFDKNLGIKFPKIKAKRVF